MMCMEKCYVMTSQLVNAGNDDEEDEQDDERLRCWRPAGADAQTLALLKRKKQSAKADDSSDDDAGSKVHSDGGSIASSISKQMSDSDPSGGGSASGDDAKSDGSKSEDSDKKDSSDDDEDEEDEEALELARREMEKKKNKKMVIRMRFDPLLELHEPLEADMDEPAMLFGHTKKKRKTLRAERAAIDDVMADYRKKATSASEWMADNGMEECQIAELSQAVGQDIDDFRFALVQSKRFTVCEDGTVRRSLLQRLLDVMEGDLETLQEVLDKLMNSDTAEVREAVTGSEGQLRIKNAHDIELIERVDLEAEAKQQREQEKENRQKEKEEKRRNKAKRGRKAKAEDKEEEESESSSDGDDNINQEAERKALGFRRVQVQRKIEDFLKTYTKGQNLTKITAKGRRYHRRVYVDTARKALVVQGASGPKFFPFASMKEVDMETRTSKEGRVETVVICAISKRGRIVKELMLAFPDQAKANTFVNCVTLFSLALRTKES